MGILAVGSWVSRKKDTHASIKKPLTVLYQICELIPQNLIPKLARRHGVDKKNGTFTPWSHVVSMLYAHLAHCLSLNDVADALQLHRGYLKTIRQASPLSRNGLSYANMKSIR